MKQSLTRTDSLARFGYAARGVVYLLFGYIAFESTRGATGGKNAVFEWVGRMPAGTLVLWLIVLGLVCYGLYKWSAAFLDLSSDGHDPKGAAKRIGKAAGGTAYLAAAWAAARFALGYQHYASSSDNSGQAVSTAMQMPLGSVLVAVAGTVFLGMAGFQIGRAVTAGFMKHISTSAPPFTCWLGRIGYAARGVVFALVAWSLFNAAWYDNANDVHNLGGVLASLSGQRLIYDAVAIGLAVFGAFSLLLARYRIVPRIDVVDGVRRKVRAHVA